MPGVDGMANGAFLHAGVEPCRRPKAFSTAAASKAIQQNHFFSLTY